MIPKEQIVTYFKAGETMEEIAIRFSVTKERIRQVLNNELDLKDIKKTIKINRKLRSKKISEERKITFTCQNCNKEFSAKYTRRRFCGKECFIKYQKKNSLTPEERIEKKRAFMREYYKNKLKLN